MRCSKFIIVFLLCLCFTTNSEAQVKFGIRGGLNLVDFSIKNASSTFDESNRAGFFFGPTMKVSIPILPIDFDLSVIYDERTAHVEDVSATHKTINIPLNVRFSVGLGSSFNVFAFGGPQYTFNRSDVKTIFTDVSSQDWSWRSGYLSFNVGLGFTLFKHIELRGNYNIACGRTAEVTVYDVLRTAITDKYKNHYNAWQIDAAVYF
jgi:hypothetical protein